MNKIKIMLFFTCAIAALASAFALKAKKRLTGPLYTISHFQLSVPGPLRICDSILPFGHITQTYSEHFNYISVNYLNRCQPGFFTFSEAE